MSETRDESGRRDPKQPILPGAPLGVLGGGQLGRMFALAAQAMGYRVHVLCPDADAPAAQVADRVELAEYDDVEACERFAQRVAAVTFEFENVASSMAEAAERYAVVRPAGRVLHTTQDRQREKGFLRDAGLPVTPFEPIDSLDDLPDAAKRLGLPCVLKTASWGYDGKGQAVIRHESEFESAWEEIGRQRAVLEKRIDFACEFSVVAVRGSGGELATYGPIHNAHANHILDVSTCPVPPKAGVTEDLGNQALDVARRVMTALDVAGVLCVELFVAPPVGDRPAELMINELAPRPHNSGHLTINAHATSQFEQQVRALAGLPLGSTRQHRPAAMANLLGEAWLTPDGNPKTPHWPASLQLPDPATDHGHPAVALHLYGKTDPRPGRKMGHLTALADTPEAAEQHARQSRDALASSR